jgi:subtilisin-like proprotein convertase family protein
MKLLIYKIFFVFIFIQFIDNQCIAQAPINDEPCNASDLIITTSCTTLTLANSIGATNSLVTGFVPMSCGGATMPKDVWFKVKTTQSGIASDTRLAITLTGNVAGQVRFLGATNCSGPFTELKCSASPTAAAPTLNVNNLTPNTIYYVQVAGYWDNSAGGPFSICCTPGPVLGCTNPYANNFNINAAVDDGTCAFTVNPISKCDAILNSSPSLLINDNQTVTDSINVSLGSNRIITDLDVIVKINHSFVSDLDISLVSPNGTTVTLFKNECGGNDNLEVYFDDNAYAINCLSPVKGFYKPTNGQLSTFNNQLTDGYWKLKIKDNALNNTGTLVSWCLKPKYQSVICNAPTQLSVDAISATTATLNWTQSGNTSLGFDVAVIMFIMFVRAVLLGFQAVGQAHFRSQQRYRITHVIYHFPFPKM